METKQIEKIFLVLLIIISVNAFSQKDNNKGMASGKADKEKTNGGKMKDSGGAGLGGLGSPSPGGGSGVISSPKKPEMKQYFVVFLKKGPKRDQDSATAAKIQEAHLKHLKAMSDAGKMDIAGPFGDDGDIRGICIYNVATAEEAKKLAEADPVVMSGRLIVEVHPFYGMPGARLK
jgi:uncharacterized protein YciI